MHFYFPAGGTTARSLSWTTNGGKHGDNNVYTGDREGTKTELLDAIGDINNWLTSETTIYDIAPGGTSFPGTAPQFTVLTGTLPVTWSHVHATTDQGKVILSWGTYSEINNAYFTVQHSSNNRDWLSLQQVTPRGSETTAASYQYIHPSPLAGINYYRILQTDIDGRPDYSKTVTATIHHTTDIRLFPNPSKNFVTIQRGDDTFALLTITDMAGKQVFQRNISGLQITLPVDQLHSGTYLLRIRTGKKDRTQMLRIL